MEKASSKKYEIDMCNGPLLGKIMIFYVPLMLSGILQLLFNAADIVVVGRFAGNQALAAVGSTGSLTNLLVNIFIGLSVGANVLVARYYGAKQDIQLKEMVQTAIATALAGGIILIFLGFFLARPALGWMGTPDDVISHSVLYMRIYFAGMPFMMVYNFGSAVLRAVGDTKRPLYYLLIAGVVNAASILIQQNGITVSFDDRQPLYVWADEFKIEEVITNFLSNAIHYALYDKKIDIFYTVKEDCVRVSVYNTGDPIPEADLDKVWIKFYKVDKARTREYGGSGIGLSIVKAIMDSLNRQCGVCNRDNGVEFWIELDTKNEEIPKESIA